MIAESFLFAVKELVKESGGEITYHKTASEATKIPKLLVNNYLLITLKLLTYTLTYI